TGDQPPALLKYYGSTEIRNARTFDRVPLEARLADDIGVAGAELIYRINNEKKEHTERFTLRGAGSPNATARHQWLLGGKVKEGDPVAFRIRYFDNLPKEFDGPHVRYFPESGNWLYLKIVQQGSSLREQKTPRQHKEIRDKLDKILAEVKQ